MEKKSALAQEYLDVAGVIILALDRKGRVSLINRKGCEVLGYPESEILGKNWFHTFIPEEIRGELCDVFRGLIRGETKFSEYHENPVVVRSGEERIIAWRNAPLRNEEKQITSVLSSGEDITERIRAEKHLAAQYRVAQTLVRSDSLQEALPALLESVCDAEDWELGEVWVPETRQILRRELTYQHASLSKSVFLTSGARLKFEPGSGLIGLAWRNGEVTATSDLEEEPFFLRHTAARVDGLHAGFAIPIASRAVLAFYTRQRRFAGPDLRRVLESLRRQIDEFCIRTEQAEALRQSESRLRTLLDTVVDAIITIDEEGIIESFNRAAEKMFGYKGRELVGKNVSILMTEEDARAHDQRLREYLVSGEAKVIGIGREVLGKRRDGTTFPIYLSVGETQWGNRRFFTGILRDFGDFRRMQEEVLQVRNLAAIGEMAASVAHEIKNPIAGISGAVQVIRDQMPATDPLREVIEEIFGQVNRLNETTRHLLMFSRPWEASKIQCRLAGLVHEITESAQEQELFEQIDFVFEGPETSEVRIDPGLFKHVLWNVIDNAASSMSSGGTIHYSFEEDSSAIRLRVQDTGPGIAPAIQDKLFRPFFTTKTRGTGLGLPICKKIMEAHGGTIEIGNGGRQGTLVTLTFPRNR